MDSLSDDTVVTARSGTLCADRDQDLRPKNNPCFTNTAKGRFLVQPDKLKMMNPKVAFSASNRVLTPRVLPMFAGNKSPELQGTSYMKQAFSIV